VKKFVRLFLDVDLKSTDPYEDFSGSLIKLSVQHLVPLRTVVPQSGTINAEEARDSRKVAKRTFYRAIEATKTVMLSARDKRPVDLRKAKRAVQSIVDLILNEEFSLNRLTAIKNHDEYTFQHCVNVSILSISLGQRLGLNKKMLGELGVAAILHDLGKATIPGWVLNKPGKLTAEEWKPHDRPSRPGREDDLQAPRPERARAARDDRGVRAPPEHRRERLPQAGGPSRDVASSVESWRSRTASTR